MGRRSLLTHSLTHSLTRSRLTSRLALSLSPVGPNHLHGGSDGLHRKRWTATEVTDTAVTFVYLSPDGEAGYPGSVAFSVKYELIGENQLCVTMRGRVLGDLQTPINLAQHTYFNLAGHASGRDVLGHELKLVADTFLELDASQIPTGVRRSVGDLACMDFRRGKMIGAGIEDVPGGMGYDHNYCFSSVDGDTREVREVAELRDPQSGRVMVVSTDAPGAQLYVLKRGRFVAPLPRSLPSVALM